MGKTDLLNYKVIQVHFSLKWGDFPCNKYALIQPKQPLSHQCLDIFKALEVFHTSLLKADHHDLVLLFT
jgi:hypothetical protein